MEENLECPICFDIFGTNSSHIKAPKVIKCGDTICKECLETILNNSKEEYFLCPLCKEKINKESNIDDYTTNKRLINMVNSSFNIEGKEGDNTIRYNIIALGNSGVGKTCIFKRLKRDVFTEQNITTVGNETIVYFVKYIEKKYELTLNDQSGQERFKAITKYFFKEYRWSIIYI